MDAMFFISVAGLFYDIFGFCFFVSRVLATANLERQTLEVKNCASNACAPNTVCPCKLFVAFCCQLFRLLHAGVISTFWYSSNGKERLFAHELSMH